MQIVKKSNPYIRKSTTSTGRMMIDVLIALLPVVIFAIYRFGFEALFRIVLSLVIMIAAEILAIGLIKTPKEANQSGKLPGKFLERFKDRYKNLNINHFLAPAISGVIFALLLPSNIHLYVLIVGALFGIIVGKLLFGGLGSNIFNPAAIGRVFVGLTFASFFKYSGTDIITGATPLSSMSLDFASLINRYSLSDLFLGFIPGSMGEVSKLLILVGAAYLLIKKAADFRVMLSTIVSFSVLIFFAGLAISPELPFSFLMYHLFSGGIIFLAVFMATDPVTSPTTRPGRILYGALIGLVTGVIRMFGAYPEGAAMAIIICNMFVPFIDYYKWAKNKYTWKFFLILLVPYLGLIPLFYFANGGTL